MFYICCITMRKCFVLIFGLFHLIQWTSAMPKCDTYKRKNAYHEEEKEEEEEEEVYLIHTIANYKFPSYRVILQTDHDAECPCSSNKLLCLRKCCLHEDTFTGNTKMCNVPSNKDFQFDMHAVPNLLPGNYVMVYGSFCPSTIRSIGDFKLLENSSVQIGQDLMELNEYCVDYFEDEGKYMALQCTGGRAEFDEIYTGNLVYTICQMCSEFCLLITIIVYACIDVLRTLPGKILLCYVTSLLVTNAFYIILQLFTIYEGQFCIISAFTVQFSFLASFFWLNIMCIDLWWTFSGYRPFNGSPKERDSKKFLVYCLYAWGFPSLIVALTIFVQYNPVIPDWLVRPGFGDGMCWFTSYKAIVIYFYSFISIILFSNLLMFISTTLILKRHKKEAKMFKRNGSRRHMRVENDKQRFNLYLKLFIIMGVNWIMEVLSFFFPDMAPLWMITDIGNMLQGVFIFLIFVCKRKVLLLLNKKLFPNRIMLASRGKLDSQTASGSSVASVMTPKHQFSTRLSNLQNESEKSPSFVV